LERVLIQGEKPLCESERITGLKEPCSACMVLSSLINDEILQSETPKGPISLDFGGNMANFFFHGNLQRTEADLLNYHKSAMQTKKYSKKRG
jgi:hypothetical protein